MPVGLGTGQSPSLLTGWNLKLDVASKWELEELQAGSRGCACDGDGWGTLGSGVGLGEAPEVLLRLKETLAWLRGPVRGQSQVAGLRILFSLPSVSWLISSMEGEGGDAGNDRGPHF